MTASLCIFEKGHSAREDQHAGHRSRTMLPNFGQQRVDFGRPLARSVLCGGEARRLDRIRAVGLVPLHREDAAGQVRFQPLPSPLPSPIVGLFTAVSRSDRRRSDLSTLNGGCLKPSACSKQPWKARRSAADAITIDAGGFGPIVRQRAPRFAPRALEQAGRQFASRPIRRPGVSNSQIRRKIPRRATERLVRVCPSEERQW
ncbi:hypothetical protein SAMN05444164_3764 [Bradyrhizobium erythrophlei]|uniref:Uncharacterized protein n=1 Tax=Bradyrhizobium erythrophlei TaxID=1437360 RepID=A0A1H4Y313_9BRAD|nr:hypothetical protein SAMN05444164_3764 [Bradyrhizobium erythrophlei]